MRNIFKIATMSILIAGTMCSTSCNSNDGILEEIEDAQPETAKWQEPYHTIGASVDQVKSYMAVSMKRILCNVRLLRHASNYPIQMEKDKKVFYIVLG